MEKEVKGDGMTCLASICLLSSPKCEAMLKREGMGRYRWKGFLLSHQLTIFSRSRSYPHCFYSLTACPTAWIWSDEWREEIRWLWEEIKETKEGKNDAGGTAISEQSSFLYFAHFLSQEIRHLMSQELTENRDGGGMVWVSSCSRSPGQHWMDSKSHDIARRDREV